jgi:hypothetical protein
MNRFVVFPHLLPANTELVLRIVYDRFFPDPLQFIIHLHPIVRRCIYRVIHTPAGNSDNNLESQYTCNRVFGLQSDSKLLSGLPEGRMSYSILETDSVVE